MSTRNRNGRGEMLPRLAVSAASKRNNKELSKSKRERMSLLVFVGGAAAFTLLIWIAFLLSSASLTELQSKRHTRFSSDASDNTNIVGENKFQPIQDPEIIQKSMLMELQCDRITAPEQRTALGLFCRVASSSSGALKEERDVVVLDIYQMARRQISDAADLRQILSWAVATQAKLLHQYDVELWAPEKDTGMKTVLQELNVGNGIAEYGVTDANFRARLGGRDDNNNNNNNHNPLFVDIGSNLGLVTLAVLKEFPRTRVVSLEAAAPTWLYQLLNLGRNLPRQYLFGNSEINDAPQVTVFSYGLGARNGDTFHMLWRPYSTTSTRDWVPDKEKRSDGMDVTVTTLTLRSALYRATHPHTVDNIENEYIEPIDILKVDCEGCEYNAIPSMTNGEWEAVRSAVGEFHWGYIPSDRKPSSKRAEQTHQRLCQFANFASQAKECCAFPDLSMRDSTSGAKSTTVSAVAKTLCNGFDEWAKESQLFTIPDDSGWIRTD